MSSKIPDLQLTISIADTLIQKISEGFNHCCCSESEILKEKKGSSTNSLQVESGS
jgi:hypothetical protein